MPILALFAIFLASVSGLFSNSKPASQTGQQKEPRDIHEPEKPRSPAADILDGTDPELRRFSQLVAAGPGAQPTPAPPPVPTAPPASPRPSPEVVLTPQINNPDCPPPSNEEAPIQVVRNVVARLGCPTPEQRGLDAAQADYAAAFSQSGARNQSLTVQGLRLSVQGTEEEIEIAKRILGPQPPALLSAKTENCRDVRCVLTAGFGNEEAALRAMVMAKKYGYALTLSQHQNLPGKDTIWSVDQLNRIEKLLSNLPPSFHKMGILKSIHLVHPDSVDSVRKKYQGHIAFSGLWVQTENSILLKDDKTETKLAPDHVEKILAHELGHAFDSNYTVNGVRFSQSSGYDNIARWTPNPNYKPGSPVKEESEFLQDRDQSHEHVSGYSRTNPIEDWADSVAYYVYSPRYTMGMAPTKYQTLKRGVFEGREYTTLGRKDWPELDKLIQSRGGCPSFVRSCIVRIESPIYISEKAWFRDERHSIQDMVTFADETSCHRAAAKDLVPSLKDSQAFCTFDGAKGIEEHLRATCSSDLWDVLAEMENAMAKPQNSPLSNCWAQKDFTPECAVEQTLKAATSRGVPPDGTLRNRDIVRDMYAKLSKSKGLAIGNEVFKHIKPTELFGLCLSDLTKIRGGSGTPYSRGNLSTSDPSFGMCESKIQSGLVQRGFKLSPSDSGDIVRSLLSNPAITAVQKTFEEQVVRNLVPETAQCRDKACRLQVADSLVEKWLQASGAGAGDLSPELRSKITAVIAP